MEIRVGQVWQEKKYGQRAMRIEDLIHTPDGSLFAAKMRLVRGSGRPETTVQAYILRAGWNLLEEAPDAPPRQIKLTLAKDTTDTECGSCPAITESEQCGAFDQKDLDNNSGGIFLRLPSCIAAEVK